MPSSNQSTDPDPYHRTGTNLPALDGKPPWPAGDWAQLSARESVSTLTAHPELGSGLVARWGEASGCLVAPTRGLSPREWPPPWSRSTAPWPLRRQRPLDTGHPNEWINTAARSFIGARIILHVGM